MPEQHGPAAPRPKTDDGKSPADDQATRLGAPPGSQDATQLLRPTSDSPDATRLIPDARRQDADATRLGGGTTPPDGEAEEEVIEDAEIVDEGDHARS